MVLVDAPERYMSFAVDGKNLDLGKVIDGETVQSREHAVPAPADVAPGAHLVATASGDGYTVALVQVDVDLAQLQPRAYAVARSIAWQADSLEHAKIQDRAPWIVDYEVLVAMAAAANGGAHACIDDALQCFGRLLGGFTQLNLGNCFGIVAVPA